MVCKQRNERTSVILNPAHTLLILFEIGVVFSWRTWRTSSKPSLCMAWSLMISLKPTTCLRAATWRRSRQHCSPSLAWWVFKNQTLVLGEMFSYHLFRRKWNILYYGVWLDLVRCLFTQAKTKGCQSRVDIGVKYADKQERMFDEEKMKAGQCVIGLQVYFGGFLETPRGFKIWRESAAVQF